MVLFNMEIQKPLRREILPALRTPIDVRLAVMHLVVFVGSKRDCFPMGR